MKNLIYSVLLATTGQIKNKINKNNYDISQINV